MVIVAAAAAVVVVVEKGKVAMKSLEATVISESMFFTVEFFRTNEPTTATRLKENMEVTPKKKHFELKLASTVG